MTDTIGYKAAKAINANVTNSFIGQLGVPVRMVQG